MTYDNENILHVRNKKIKKEEKLGIDSHNNETENENRTELRNTFTTERVIIVFFSP